MAYQKQEPTGEEADDGLVRPPRPEADGTTGWTDRVRFSDELGGFAYRPDELIVMGTDSSVAQAVELLAQLRIDAQSEEIGAMAVRLRGSFDVEMVAAELRSIGLRADPNYVMFAHACACGCCAGVGANPFNANPFNANPFNANPFNANPFNANPFNANPFNANPFNANPFNANPFNANPFNANPFNANPFNANPFNANFRATGVRASSAVPASDPELVAPTLPTTSETHTAIVLDTGIAGGDDTPALLAGSNVAFNNADWDSPDLEPVDGHLDAASGHGTFIAGVIEQLAPGRVVLSARVLSTMGEGDSVSIAAMLDSLVDTGSVDKYTVLNLSFGGYADSNMPIVAAAIRRVQRTGAVVVASAGNEGSCQPTYPAALPGVVSVGSIEPAGPAPYSNYGGWVRACAPGTSVISSFFKDFDGAIEATGTSPGDPDHYEEWANWTGTSFAAPIVVAALLRHMAVTDSDAKTAVKEIIDDPRLFRFPGLGTVVNLVP